MNNNGPFHLSPKQLDIWNNISRQLHTASEIDLFLDYDGTITPIRSTPAEAVLEPETVHVLQQLIQLPHLKVTMVTGRSMADIQKLVLFKNIGFVANHGFHVLQDGKEWRHPEAERFIKKLRKLYTILQGAFQPFPKSFLEDKQFTLSIHYRNVSVQEQTAFKAIARKTIYEFDSRLVLTEGKEVLEVRPPVDWGKGRAVMEILSAQQHSPRSLQMYIGDDITDEDAFQVLQSSGITIHVGNTADTQAHYYVNDVDEVLQILKMIIRLQTHRSNHHPT